MTKIKFTGLEVSTEGINRSLGKTDKSWTPHVAEYDQDKLKETHLEEWLDTHCQGSRRLHFTTERIGGKQRPLLVIYFELLEDAVMFKMGYPLAVES